MNSENNKTSDSCRPLLKLSDKMDQKTNDKIL